MSLFTTKFGKGYFAGFFFLLLVGFEWQRSEYGPQYVVSERLRKGD